MTEAKCPKCEASLNDLRVVSLDLTNEGAPLLRGFAYVCPGCRTILGTQVNPLLLQNQALDQIGGLLRGEGER